MFLGSEDLHQNKITLSQIVDINIKFRIGTFLHIHDGGTLAQSNHKGRVFS